MTIIEALRDRRLFGALPTFRDLTPWGAWCVLLKATYGLPLRSDEQEVFRRHTGQTTYAPPSGGWREAVAIVGRQSGKTEIASKIAAFEAVRASAASDGTELYAVLVAQDQRSALRTLLSRAKAPFTQVPALQQTVAKSITSSITLKNNVTLAAYPCRPEAVRGLRASVVVLDELAYYRSSEGFPLDTEMLRSVRPLSCHHGWQAHHPVVPVCAGRGALGSPPQALWPRRCHHADLARVCPPDEPPFARRLLAANGA